MKRKDDIEKDLWFATEMEALSKIEPPHEVDVCDAVMERIAKQPTVVQFNTKRRRTGIITTAAAACIAGLVLVRVATTGNDLQAATASMPSLSTRISDVYDYYADYATDYAEETPSYQDNPMSQLI